MGKTQEEILGEIAQAGYAGAPAGPDGDVSAHQLLDRYGKHGLKPAPGYLGVDFWDKKAEEAILENAHRFGAFSQALGLTELIFATYESSRRRARVDLPLDIDDSPLHAMIEDGELVIMTG